MWKIIEGYPKYKISDSGDIINIFSGKILKQSINPNGYKTVRLSNGLKFTTLQVHRLVAKAFLESFSEDLYVNHIDCDKTNNSISNLEMVTLKENMQHAVRNNLLHNTFHSGCERELLVVNDKETTKVVGLLRFSNSLGYKSVPRCLRDKKVGDIIHFKDLEITILK